MRRSESGPRTQSYKIKLPAGTTINSLNTWGSLLPIFGSPDDNIIANWAGESFGPGGVLQLQANITSDGQGQVYAWNFTANPITTGLDLYINVQIIPKD